MGNSRRCDLDFADDVALLTDSKEDMKKITLDLSNQAAVVGLLFNIKKNKLMEVDNGSHGGGQRISGYNICINGEAIEIVSDLAI